MTQRCRTLKSSPCFIPRFDVASLDDRLQFTCRSCNSSIVGLACKRLVQIARRLRGLQPHSLNTRLRSARAHRLTMRPTSRSFRHFTCRLLQARRQHAQTTRLRYAHAHRQAMTTGPTMTTAPTTAQLQMPTKDALAPTMMTLRTAATGRRSDLQTVRAHDCTRCVYAAYACAAHNIKLLEIGEGRENFGG